MNRHVWEDNHHIWTKSNTLPKCLLSSGLMALSPWGEMLRQLLKARGESPRAFALRIDYDYSSLTGAMRGHPGKKPPLRRISGWADKLQLEGDQRDRFILLAELQHAPARIQNRFLDLEDALYEVQRRVAAMEERVLYVAELVRQEDENTQRDAETG